MKKVSISLSVMVLSFLLGSIITIFVLNKEYDIDSINESLVYIEATSFEDNSTGSGFVYKTENNKNYIITSYHILNGYDDIYVYNRDGNKYKADIASYNEANDIAVISVADKLDLKNVKIGNSDDLKVTDEIYAVGTPIDYRYFGTIAKGIVSNLDRKIVVDGMEYNTIQIDSNINLGNSGGPLLDKKGRVVGLIFIKEDNIDGVGFAIPINFVMETIEKMEDKW